MLFVRKQHRLCPPLAKAPSISLFPNNPWTGGHNMFFIGIFGTDAKVVPVGQISGVPCAACGRQADFSVCRQYSYVHAFFIPLVKYGISYLATCPHCASVYELNPESGKRMLRGEPVHPSPSDLHLLKNNCVPRCASCGAPRQQGDVFCSKCGTKL